MATEDYNGENAGGYVPRHSAGAVNAQRARSSERPGAKHGASQTGNLSEAWRYGTGEMKIPRQATATPISSIPTAGSDDTPRPIGVDPAETGSFSRLATGEGAHIGRGAATEHMRDDAARKMMNTEAILQGSDPAAREKIASHQPSQSLDRKYVILVAAAAVVAIILGIFFVRGVVLPALTTAEEQTNSEQQQAAAAGSIEYRDYTYTLVRQDDGRYGLVSTSSSGASETLFEIDGVPVTIALYNGAIIVPENLDGDTWDVIGYTLGASSVASQVVDGEGNPVVGEGTIVATELSDGTLTVTTNAGETVQVSLS